MRRREMLLMLALCSSDWHAENSEMFSPLMGSIDGPVCDSSILFTHSVDPSALLQYAVAVSSI